MYLKNIPKINKILKEMLFKASVSLLFFYLDDLSIDVSGVLKSLATIVLLSFSPFVFVNICFMYLGAPMLGIYSYNCYISLLD